MWRGSIQARRRTTRNDRGRRCSGGGHGGRDDRSARAPRVGAARGANAPRKRMLMIVNPYATTVSDRLKNLVVYALRGTLPGRCGRHRVPRPRHRAVPRGGPRGLRRGRRVRRRRHRQRGGQRAGRVGHAAHAACPAGARTCTAGCSGSRPTSSTRPSTCCGWPTTGSPRRGRPRRASASASSCSPPASGSTPASSSGSTPTRGSRRASASGTTRRPRCGRSTAATCSTRRGSRPSSAARRVDGRHGAGRPERDAVHVLRRPPGAHGRGRDARQRRPRRRGARARQPDRHPDDRLAGAVETRPAQPPPPGRAFSGSSASHVRSLDERPLPLQVDGDYIGEVDEAEFGVLPRRPRRWSPRCAGAVLAVAAACRGAAVRGPRVRVRAPAAGSAELPDLPAEQPVEPAGRPAPGGQELGAR